MDDDGNHLSGETSRTGLNPRTLVAVQDRPVDLTTPTFVCRGTDNKPPGSKQMQNLERKRTLCDGGTRAHRAYARRKVRECTVHIGTVPLTGSWLIIKSNCYNGVAQRAGQHTRSYSALLKFGFESDEGHSSKVCLDRSVNAEACSGGCCQPPGRLLAHCLDPVLALGQGGHRT